jgi:DNA polymerase-3 subunit delta'
MIYPWYTDFWQQLLSRLSAHSGQSPLLCGPDGCGVTELGHALAAWQLCDQPGLDGACGRCSQCLLIEAGHHPDLMHIYPASRDQEKKANRILVDQIREMVLFCSTTPLKARSKVVLVEPAELLNINAANALLKTLEEPGETTRFVLVSHNVASVLPTIRSRCGIQHVPPPEKSVVMKWLVAETEASEDMVESRLLLAGGCPLASLALLEDGDEVDPDQVIRQIQSVVRGESCPIETAAGLAPVGVMNVVTWWWNWLLGELKLSLDHAPGKSEILESFGVTDRQAVDFSVKLIEARQILSGTSNPNQELLLESLLLDWKSVALSAEKVS